MVPKSFLWCLRIFSTLLPWLTVLKKPVSNRVTLIIKHFPGQGFLVCACFVKCVGLQKLYLHYSYAYIMERLDTRYYLDSWSIWLSLDKMVNDDIWIHQREIYEVKWSQDKYSQCQVFQARTHKLYNRTRDFVIGSSQTSSKYEPFSDVYTEETS